MYRSTYLNIFSNASIHLLQFNNFIQNNKEKLANILDEVQGFLENSVYELNWYKKYAPRISKSLTSNNPSSKVNTFQHP